MSCYTMHLRERSRSLKAERHRVKCLKALAEQVRRNNEVMAAMLAWSAQYSISQRLLYPTGLQAHPLKCLHADGAVFICADCAKLKWRAA